MQIIYTLFGIKCTLRDFLHIDISVHPFYLADEVRKTIQNTLFYDETPMHLVDKRPLMLNLQLIEFFGTSMDIFLPNMILGSTFEL
ncbi:hypothetical protein [Maribacter sp. MAR_2009_72]|uniref:hypothetical protein n=1 Tax=Maribacter sp. MAR_2009_72 TaxID=1250050 RepID=UPI00119AE36F|nr:hypothetical protein [Maribacter sp. MAR_2009_72]TVZ15912.1 hypothetical protein JM81_2164 [Maribacter sp. MAR_2009_72]